MKKEGFNSSLRFIMGIALLFIFSFIYTFGFEYQEINKLHYLLSFILSLVILLEVYGLHALDVYLKLKIYSNVKQYTIRYIILAAIVTVAFIMSHIFHLKFNNAWSLFPTNMLYLYPFSYAFYYLLTYKPKKRKEINQI